MSSWDREQELERTRELWNFIEIREREEAEAEYYRELAEAEWNEAHKNEINNN
ncbi:hypothetical protein OFO01_07265 [Campylobacter sp. JMF_01 NE2]|uniref:hypothetical protein n=1 Tax=unclassified Campylobacter TaxID=2593542 RepID=UPI0022EA007D|nr:MULTISPECIES: hypothetical protein [unclassified Campylobacter]MDA3053237.1 hypothetical protein [Campylobacter sp. JMF_03 NE3]MDA3067580.1 hypothetical protein [Campylobacter sp. JMF_01 NE2]